MGYKEYMNCEKCSKTYAMLPDLVLRIGVLQAKVNDLSEMPRMAAGLNGKPIAAILRHVYFAAGRTKINVVPTAKYTWR